ncbi:MAG: CAP domain-containing protein [Dehalococcoidia bacterium]
MQKVISWLIVAALFTGIVGCAGVNCDLTIASTAGGSVTTPGDGTSTYAAGELVDLVAIPAAGYRFINWTGDVDTVADVSAASTTVIMNANHSITANFEEIPLVQYSLNISGTAGGTVAAPGDGYFTYDAGMVIDLTATPSNGHEFINWSGDVVTIADINAASTTITMNDNYSITANFEEIPPDQYDLSLSSTAGGSVTTPGEATFTYDEGEVIDLVAEAEEGYQFVNWTGDVSTIDNSESASATITINGDYSITANFEPVPVVRSYYYLTTSSTAGGSVTNPGQGTYVCYAGTVVSLVATAAGGYQFVNWTGDVSTIADVDAVSTTITVNGNYSIRANFEQIPGGQFGLSISSSTGGTVTAPGEGTFTYDAGTVIGLTATPASGYYFVNWTGDVGTIGNVNDASTTITMNGSYSIRADFATESSSPPGIGYTEAEAEALIIVLVNDERQQFGLSALIEDPLLTSLAREHSISMVENGFFGHERYPGERSLSYNQPPGTIRGENLAMIPTRRTIPGPYLSLQEVCEWAVSAWMSSAGHRANILEPRYTKTGVGVSFSEGAEYLYITQVFEGSY